MTAFDDLEPDRQVEALRQIARAGADTFGIEVDQLDLVVHAFNTTFRVQAADGSTFAVRVNTNSQSSPAHVVAQHAWQRAITAQTNVVVPVPQRTAAGTDVVVIPGGDLGRDFLVVAHSWLDGDDVGECDEEQSAALGEAMAQLHRQAAHWAPPLGGRLTAFNDPLFGDPDVLTDRLGTLAPADKRVVREGWRRAAQAFVDVGRAQRPMVVHADLHGGNLKWHDGQLAIFDFDDAGMGTPSLDLAVATFYLRSGSECREVALRAGYERLRPWPTLRPEVFEGLVAGRLLLLANSLFLSSTPDLTAMAPSYLDRTVERLSSWLDTGRFVLDPPGVD